MSDEHIQNEQLHRAVTALKSGGVIAYPTEAVFGLGCDPENEAAINKLLQLKNRGTDKGLILIAASYEQVKPFVSGLDKETEQEILASWPGPVTWLVPASESIIKAVHGKYSTVAVRVSAHPLVIKLCNAFGGPIISTSANPEGEEPARTSEQVKNYFNDNLDEIVEGQTSGLNKPSEIRDAISKQVIRSA